MEFNIDDLIDSIDKLIERDGIELEVYAWNIIKEHIKLQSQALEDCRMALETKDKVIKKQINEIARYKSDIKDLIEELEGGRE